MSSTARRTAILLVLAAMLCAGASAAWADVKVWKSDATFGSGGEFTVQILPGDSLRAITSTKTAEQATDIAKGHGPNGFRTFCVQAGQNFVYGAPYTWQIATSTDHSLPHYPLTPQVAYLFHRWNSGVLSGYNYNPTTPDGSGKVRSDYAGQLQTAIWALMNQPGHGTPAAGTQARAWYDEANSHADTSIHSVRVLRLYGPNGAGPLSDDHQDQLIETPEPASLALLAIGALPILPIVRRRRPLV